MNLLACKLTKILKFNFMDEIHIVADVDNVGNILFH